jgi:hypothetical protein
VVDGRLPKLKEELQGKLQEVDKQLDELPKSLSENPQGHLLNLCRDFLVDVESKTERNRAHPQFFKRLYEIYSDLQKRILATKLQFSVSDFDDLTSIQPQNPVPPIGTINVPQALSNVGQLTPPLSPTSSRTLGDDTEVPKGTPGVIP